MTRTGAKVLIVEDDEALRDLLCAEIRDAGHELRAVGSVEAARIELDAWPVDLVVTDLRLPGSDGTHLLEITRGLDPAPAVIVVTAFGTVPQAVAAIREGADDFLTKPIDFDRFHLAVERALHVRHLERTLAALRDTLAGRRSGLVGQSRPMSHLSELIEVVAASGGPALVLGESGTGKELVARAIHARSERASGPFVAINCAGVPEALMESEFFGHEAGAFTGAAGARQGLFAQASGGVLLLDEIGEMPLQMQAKLLRVLQDGLVRPVGGDREIAVDVRIVAATNKDLAEEVAAGRFREDLYYRLETFTLEIPPLRERGDDVDLLAVHFVETFTRDGGQPPRIGSEALDLLRAYPFPGNVRELRNAMERAVAFAGEGPIRPEHLPVRIRSHHRGHTGDPLRGLLADGGLPSLEELQRRYLDHVLELTGGNKRRCAALLGIGRRTLYRWLEETPQRNDETQPGSSSVGPGE